MQNLRLNTLLFLCLSWPNLALAALINLDFEGISNTYPFTDMPLIQDFYNGGHSSNGNSGNNFGIGFSHSAQAICLVEQGVSSADCSNASRGGLGDPASAQTGLYFNDPSNAYINIAQGFSNVFSLFYSTFTDASIDLFDGLNGTGNLVTSLDLRAANFDPNCAINYDNVGFCGFTFATVAFTEKVKSISFANAGSAIVFDDLTFGTAQVHPVSAPSTILLFILSTLALFCWRYRDHKRI